MLVDYAVYSSQDERGICLHLDFATPERAMLENNGENKTYGFGGL